MIHVSLYYICGIKQNVLIFNYRSFVNHYTIPYIRVDLVTPQLKGSKAQTL